MARRRSARSPHRSRAPRAGKAHRSDRAGGAAVPAGAPPIRWAQVMPLSSSSAPQIASALAPIRVIFFATSRNLSSVPMPLAAPVISRAVVVGGFPLAIRQEPAARPVGGQGSTAWVSPRPRCRIRCAGGCWCVVAIGVVFVEPVVARRQVAEGMHAPRRQGDRDRALTVAARFRGVGAWDLSTVLEIGGLFPLILRSAPSRAPARGRSAHRLHPPGATSACTARPRRRSPAEPGRQGSRAVTVLGVKACLR